MNILQILPELNVGGVETGTIDLAKHLVRLGHKAVVVSAGGELVKELEACGAIHYQLPVHKKSFFSIIKTKQIILINADQKNSSGFLIYSQSNFFYFSCASRNEICRYINR